MVKKNHKRAAEIRNRKNPARRRARAEEIAANSPKLSRADREKDLENRIQNLEDILKDSSLAKWEHVRVSKALAKKKRQLARSLRFPATQQESVSADKE